MHLLKIHFLGCINAVGCIKKRHAPSAYTKSRQFSQCIDFFLLVNSLELVQFSIGYMLINIELANFLKSKIF